jgi:hypothetical protein
MSVFGPRSGSGRRLLRPRLLVAASMSATIYVTATLLPAIMFRTTDGPVPLIVYALLAQTFAFAIAYLVFAWRRRRDHAANGSWRATPLLLRGWVSCSLVVAAAVWLVSVLRLELPLPSRF